MSGDRVRILGAAEVDALLPMADAVGIMADALRAVSDGTARAPLRWALPAGGGGGLLGLMPGAMPGLGRFGVKAVSVFPRNRGRGRPSHQGLVALFDEADGRLLALMDAHAVTALRTAAATAAATRALARPESAVLGLLGAGEQASRHVAALRCVLPLREVRAWSPTPARREAFAAAEEARHGLEVRAVAAPEDAVRGADVVCTVTSSATPVLAGAWLADGQHVNLVGASVAAAREADDAVVARGRVFVESRETAAAQAGEILGAAASGAVGPDPVAAEIGEVLSGRAPGRVSRSEVTVYKSLGHAAQDLAAAAALLERAEAAGAGVLVPW